MCWKRYSILYSFIIESCGATRRRGLLYLFNSIHETPRRAAHFHHRGFDTHAWIWKIITFSIRRRIYDIVKFCKATTTTRTDSINLILFWCSRRGGGGAQHNTNVTRQSSAGGFNFTPDWRCMFRVYAGDCNIAHCVVHAWHNPQIMRN